MMQKTKKYPTVTTEMSDIDTSINPLAKDKLFNEGGEDIQEHEEAVKPIDKIGEFLCQIPPDWEKAEAHARANLVVDSAMTEIDLSKENSYCICCQMPLPEDEHFFPLCTDNTNLGIMGPGYPLFFEFIKSVGFLMLILTLIFFIPCAVLMYDAYKDLKGIL